MAKFRYLIVGVICVMLFTCTPKEQEFLPSIQDGQITDAYFSMADDAKLPYQSWLPDGKPKAIVLAAHGFNDYGKSYRFVGEFLKTKGIATYAYDQRGFGKTENFGIWSNEKNMVRDLITNIKSLKKKYPNTPLYIMGESMGGAVVIVTLADNHNLDIEGAILSAPAVWGDKGMSPFLRATSWISAHTIPYMKFSGKGFGKQPSDNIEVLQDLSNDPLFIKNTRLDSTYGLVKLMGNAYRNGGKINKNTPILMLYGDNDQLVPKKATSDFVNSLVADYTFVYYPNSYHLLTRGLSRDIVLKDIAKWIENREIISEYDKKNFEF